MMLADPSMANLLMARLTQRNPTLLPSRPYSAIVTMNVEKATDPPCLPEAAVPSHRSGLRSGTWPDHSGTPPPGRSTGLRLPRSDDSSHERRDLGRPCPACSLDSG